MNRKNINLRTITQEKPVITDFRKIKPEYSLFYDYYLNTFRSIENYLLTLSKDQNEKTNSFLGKNTSNNIFALLGDRGAGKTSCMLSIAEFLLNTECCEDINKYFLGEDFKAINKTTFCTINVIDPSYFDDKHNIVSLVISQMYNQYQKAVEKQSFSENDSKKDIQKRLLENFSKVSENLDVMLSNSDKDDSSIEKLVNLSGAVELKENFNELVKNWILYIYGDKTDRKLLLLIDDIDLNTKYGDEMLEQIRKYFIQDNIIVLMSLNITQMELVKEENILQEFSSSNKQSDMVESIRKMGVSYLTKVIPYEHRVFINDLKSNMDLIVDDAQILETPFDAPKNIKNDNRKLRPAFLYEYIPMLIYEKTKYYFYSTKDNPSEIIPSNLRLLKQLSNTFEPLLSTNSENNQIYNKEWFKHYFFEVWCKENLSDKNYEKIVKVLVNLKAVVDINKTVITILKSSFGNLFDLSLQPEKSDFIETENDESENEESENTPSVFYSIIQQEFNYIFDDKNLNANISFGDVYSVIRYIDDHIYSNDDKKILFVIKTFYSIKLYELYKKLERAKNEDDFDNLNTSEFEQLLGGSYINTVIQKILVSTQGNIPYRANRLISATALTKLIKECIDTDENHRNEDEFKNKLRLAEFFMLCTAGNFDRKSQNDRWNYTNPEYRKNVSSPYYNLPINAKNIHFDLGVFFFNLMRLDNCYRRFPQGEKIITLAKEEKSSLYNWNVNEKKYFAIFYTYDSIDLFIRKLEENYKRGNSSDDCVLLANFFKTVGEFSISLYPESLDNPKEHWPLKLSDSENILELEKVLSSFNNTKDFENIYNYWRTLKSEANLKAAAEKKVRVTVTRKDKSQAKKKDDNEAKVDTKAEKK